jgi:cell division transport system ATP-binding protein
MITVKNLSISYQQNHYILENINLNIKKGSFNVFIGETGIGKTTLLKIISGLIKPNKGEIIIGDQNLSKLSHPYLSIFRRGIGLILEEFPLLQDYTIHENLSLPLKISNFSKKNIIKKISYFLKLFNMTSMVNRFPKQLSQGENQKIHIIRAIINNPFLLVADEPFSNIDKEESIKIIQILQSLQKKGLTLLTTSHDKYDFSNRNFNYFKIFDKNSIKNEN